MLIAEDTDLDAAYVSCHFRCKEEGFLEPALPVVGLLAKKPSFAWPRMLEGFVNTQSMGKYCKQAAATVGIPGSAFSYS